MNGRPLNIIGDKVRRIRLQQGLTQPDLAAKCQTMGYNLSRESLAKIESRIRGIADYELAALAEVLKVDCNELLPERAQRFKAAKKCFLFKEE